MKKLFFIAVMVFTLAFAGSCFAEGAGSTFSKEEKVADNFVAALMNNGTYAQASTNFSADLKKNLTEAQFNDLKKQIREQVGKVNGGMQFVTYNKVYEFRKGYNGAEELVYIGSLGNDKYARVVVIFVPEGGKNVIGNFAVNGFEAKPQAQQQAAEKK